MHTATLQRRGRTLANKYKKRGDVAGNCATHPAIGGKLQARRPFRVVVARENAARTDRLDCPPIDF